MKKIKAGDIVHVTFLDHCRRTGMTAGDMPPILFEAFGRVVMDHPKHYVIATWLEVSGEIDDNTESFTILKSTIETLRRLK